MKIRSDKIETAPPHGLTARDVRLILAKVPPTWIEGLAEVRLANGPGTRAYLFHGDGRLTIYSRNGTKKQILIAVLGALAAPALNVLNVVARSPSGPEQKRLEQFTQPLVDALLSEITPPKKRSPAAHKPSKFAPLPNDVA